MRLDAERVAWMRPTRGDLQLRTAPCGLQNRSIVENQRETNISGIFRPNFYSSMQSGASSITLVTLRFGEPCDATAHRALRAACRCGMLRAATHRRASPRARRGRTDWNRGGGGERRPCPL